MPGLRPAKHLVIAERRPSRTRSRSRAPATGRPAVLVFGGAFHGRTLLTMTMTSKVQYKQGFGPFAPRSTARRRRTRTEASRPTTRSPRSSSSSRLRSIRGRSPVPCSSPFRARADSSRCRPTFRSAFRSCSAATGSCSSPTRCRAASVVPGPSGRSSSTKSSPTSSSRGSRWAAASRWRPSPGRRRSSMPWSRAGSAAPSAATRSRAPPQSPCSRRSDGRVPGAGRELGEVIRSGARRDRRAAARRSARCAASARCSRSSSTEGRAGPREGRHADGAGEGPDPPLVRALRQRHPHPRPARHLGLRTSTGDSSSWRSRLSTQAPAGLANHRPRRTSRMWRPSRSPGIRRRGRGRRRRPQIAPHEFFTLARTERFGKDDDAAADRRLRAAGPGRVLLKGRDVTRTPPYDRNVNTVFRTTPSSRT